MYFIRPIMYKFELINKNNLTNSMCSKIRGNNIITVMPFMSGAMNSIKSELIEPIPGIYIVNLTVNSKNDLYWWGSYNGYEPILLKSGSNTFLIVISNDQNVPFKSEYTLIDLLMHYNIR